MVDDLVEVYARWQMGRSERPIAQSLGMPHPTLRNCLTAAGAERPRLLVAVTGTEVDVAL